MDDDNNSNKEQGPEKRPGRFMPPYGRPPFPPPPPPPPGFRGPFPPPPPPQYEEYEEIEYVEDSDEDSLADGVYEEEIYEEYEEVEDGSPQGQFSEPPSEFEEISHGREIATSDESLTKIQQVGLEKAVTIQKETDATLRSVLILKVLAVLFILLILCMGVAFMFIKFLAKDEANPKVVSTFTDETAWILPDEYVNLLVRDFYRSIGGIAKTSMVKNKYFSGTIKIEGQPETNFYCVERRGSVYVRLGGADAESVYFIERNGKGVKLETMSYVGPSVPLEASMAETLLNLMIYDELLADAAYGRSITSGREPFRYTETVRLGDTAFESLKIKDENSFEDMYCFDISSKRLLFRIIERSNLDMRIEYYGFKDFGAGVSYPSKRRVYIDNKLVASCVVERMSVNRDVMFPR